MTLEPAHFIVVDDDAINNRMCKFAIMRHFATPSIETFLMPEVALEMIAKEYSADRERQSILFLDINMPSMDAWRFLELFSEFDEDIKNQFIIYILSASTDMQDRKRAAEQPSVAGFISKPLMANALEKVFNGLQSV